MDVSPEKQNLNSVFSNTLYWIDFYQRQYKWDADPVERLLDDIFFRFNIEYEKYKENETNIEQLIDKYEWYYLNTYVTNSIKGKTYIVDGQQRLTTLTLMLMGLRHLAVSYESSLHDWISSKIAGIAGFERKYWMFHENHIKTLDAIFKNDDITNYETGFGTTSSNLVKNYKVIISRLKGEIASKHKFETFVFYCLNRLVLINLDVNQTDVPMIFEVINDRGVRLKPYEILKGKLLGQIDKEELDNLGLNELWDSQIKKLNTISSDEVDKFFIYYLRAKYANTVGESRKYDMSYHREMFSSEMREKMDLQHNPTNVKHFLRNEFRYYSDLYHDILALQYEDENECIHVYYNKLTDMDSQMLLILSSCMPDDNEKDEKIRLISYHVDRLFCLLQLQKAYDSNDFNVTAYKISTEIRGMPADQIPEIFNKYLVQLLEAKRNTEVHKPFSYTLFKDTGNELDKRFKRYFFARIEKFIAGNTHMNMRHNMYDLVSNTGNVNGFHIEHILAYNNENVQQFDDEEVFERERNRLGALLILKGKDNVSSSNEKYEKKLKTYSNTLYWNETLREDAYKTKIDFKRMQEKYDLKFSHYDTYGPVEVEERQKLLYHISKHIWE